MDLVKRELETINNKNVVFEYDIFTNNIRKYIELLNIYPILSSLIAPKKKEISKNKFQFINVKLIKINRKNSVCVFVYKTHSQCQYHNSIFFMRMSLAFIPLLCFLLLFFLFLTIENRLPEINYLSRSTTKTNAYTIHKTYKYKEKKNRKKKQHYFCVAIITVTSYNNNPKRKKKTFPNTHLWAYIIDNVTARIHILIYSYCS